MNRYIYLQFSIYKLKLKVRLERQVKKNSEISFYFFLETSPFFGFHSYNIKQDLERIRNIFGDVRNGNGKSVSRKTNVYTEFQSLFPVIK